MARLSGEHRAHRWRIVSRGMDDRNRVLTLYGCSYRTCIRTAVVAVYTAHGRTVTLRDDRKLPDDA